MKTKPTFEMYTELQTAFDHFNRILFENKLPECMITLQRESSTYGYYSVNRFIKKNGEKIDEIAMNPEYFSIRSIPETLSTLVHEMVHLQQQHFGSPGRGRYHNHEWANWMEYVGLMPSHTGSPNGKRTGDRMSHYIVHGARFENACDQLMTTDFTLSWMDRFPPRRGITSIIEKLKLTPKAILPLTPVEPFPVEDDTGQLFLLPLNDPPTSGGIDEPYNTSTEGFLDDLAKLGLHVPDVNEDPDAQVNKSNRVKYTCPSCDIHVWGKPKLNIICGECQQSFKNEATLDVESINGKCDALRELMSTGTKTYAKH